MQSEHRMYSDFFTSGLWSMANSGSYHSAPPTAFYPMPSETQKKRKRRSFLSDILPLSLSSSTSSKESTNENAHSHPSARRRVSSLFPSSSRRWLHRIPRTTSHSKNNMTCTCPRADVTDEFVDIWITSGGPFLLTDDQEGSGFWISDTPSDYIIDGLDNEHSKSPPSQLKQLLAVPSLRSERRSRLKRKERPTSIQTLPSVPGPQSRSPSPQQLSVQISDKSEGEDNYGKFRIWRDGDIVPPFYGYGLGSDDPAHMDWREFHSDLLSITDIEND